MSYHFTLTLTDVVGLVFAVGLASAYGFLWLVTWWIKRREKKGK